LGIIKSKSLHTTMAIIHSGFVPYQSLVFLTRLISMLKAWMASALVGVHHHHQQPQFRSDVSCFHLTCSITPSYSDQANKK